MCSKHPVIDWSLLINQFLGEMVNRMMGNDCTKYLSACMVSCYRFMCSSSTTVMESLQEYEKAFKGHSAHGAYAAPPRPSYMETLALDDKDVLDVCYHLLKLYSDRTHPLHVLLNPSTMSGNQLDYSLRFCFTTKSFS